MRGTTGTCKHRLNFSQLLLTAKLPQTLVFGRVAMLSIRYAACILLQTQVSTDASWRIRLNDAHGGDAALYQVSLAISTC